MSNQTSVALTEKGAKELLKSFMQSDSPDKIKNSLLDLFTNWVYYLDSEDDESRQEKVYHFRLLFDFLSKLEGKKRN